MRSKGRTEILDTMEQDLRITPADSAALWRIRDTRTMTTPEYLAWCTYLTRDEPAKHRDVSSDEHERFEL
jgi:hypothetical protein